MACRDWGEPLAAGEAFWVEALVGAGVMEMAEVPALWGQAVGLAPVG